MSEPYSVDGCTGGVKAGLTFVTDYTRLETSTSRSYAVEDYKVRGPSMTFASTISVQELDVSFILIRSAASTSESACARSVSTYLLSSKLLHGLEHASRDGMLNG